VPFGAGARTCIGQRLALVEGLQMLATVCKNFDVRLQDPNAVIRDVADISLGSSCRTHLLCPFYANGLVVVVNYKVLLKTTPC
jgi:cytochrome P450